MARELADGVQVFTALIQLVETGLTEFTERIKGKQKTAAKQAEDSIRKLYREISELTKRYAEVKQLSRSNDHLHLLQTLPSLKASLPAKDRTKVVLRQPSFEGTVARAVAQLHGKLCEGMEKLLRAELKRAQRHAVDVAFDPDTAHPKLIMSADGKQVNRGEFARNAPDGPERFSYCVMVLGKQILSCGKFYYEVEVKGKTKWD